MKKIIGILSTLLVFILSFGYASAGSKLTVYTAIEAEDLKRYAATLMKTTQILKLIG